MNGPLPKRKTFEFQLENRKYSYQDAFLKFLAGEKQPSLDIISEQINRKPKDNFYLSSKSKAISIATSLQQQQQQQQQSSVITTSSSSSVATSNGPISVTTGGGVSTITNQINSSVITTTASYVDKENYYNASRRENLLPVNSYEYRNSYKDHYDHQGVRVNPAILKALPQELQQTITTPPPPQQQSTTTRSNASIVIAPSTSSTHQPQKSNNLINDVSQLLNYPQNSSNGKSSLFIFFMNE